MGVCSSYVLKRYVIIILTNVIIARIVKEQLLFYWIKTTLHMKKKIRMWRKFFEDELDEDFVRAFLINDDDDDDDADANRIAATSITMISIARTE